MENVLLFLTPKSAVATLQTDFTVRQAIEKMKFHRYSSVPILDENGKYVGTITEGDIFWFINSNEDGLSTYDLEDIPLNQVPRRRDNIAVTATDNITDLFEYVVNQNFVPVVDDANTFIGIITRKRVIEYLIKETKRD